MAGSGGMIIGFLTNTCEPFYRGGYERRVWAFAKQLARDGHDVRIYTSCPRNEVIEGVRFVRLGFFRSFFNQRGVRNGWADVLFTLSLLQLLWKLKARELQVLDVGATPFLHLPVVAFITRLKKIPTVLTCHEALLAALPAYVQERGHENPRTIEILVRLLGKLYSFGTSLFPKRLAVSQRTAAALAQEGFPATGVVEFGLEPEAFNPRPPEERPGGDPAQFVFCGRLMPIKSVDQSVAMLLALRWEGSAFHFDVIGDGSEKLQLESMVRNAGAVSSFRFHGEVSEEEKRRLLAENEIFILSSPREGFSIATLEAMAQGCGALVVSDPQRPNGALDFVTPDEEGICIPPGSKSMRPALQELLREPALRLKLRRAAWKRAQEYKIETQAKKLLEFYGGTTPVKPAEKSEGPKPEGPPALPRTEVKPPPLISLSSLDQSGKTS